MFLKLSIMSLKRPLKNIKLKKNELHISSDLPSHTGLGSSSSLQLDYLIFTKKKKLKKVNLN